METFPGISWILAETNPIMPSMAGRKRIVRNMCDEGVVDVE
jgi:hypothetical protein